MSTNNNGGINHSSSSDPPPPQNPIPNAPFNQDTRFGRIGPVTTVPGFLPSVPGQPPNPGRLPAGPSLDRLRRAVKADETIDTTGNKSSSADANESTSTATTSGSAGRKEGGGKKEFEEDEDDDDESDFELVDKPVYTPPDSPGGEDAAYSVTSALTNKLPPELIPDILDYAAYFPHKVLASKTVFNEAGEESYEGVRNSESKVFMTARIPDFPAMEEGTAGAGGTGEGRPGRVRRLVWKVVSKDQGWSSYHEHKDTYIGSWSWLDVEVWRQTGRTVGDNEGQAPLSDAPHEEGQWTKVSGPHLLQRNKHAHREFTEHEIVWDWKEEALADSEPEKWENGEEGWLKDGRTRNAELVKELKGGDELRVIMKCMYPGWSCMVRKCEVECFWAV